MKKTLVALTVAAFAASSASAVTVYNNEGTTVEADGSLRLLLSNTKTKKEDANGNVTSQTRAHTNLGNDGSRFGFRVKHQINEDLYALGRLELRFDQASKADGFGTLYAKRAYAGLGSKQYGEITFGRQLTIGDDISQAGFDYTYGVTKTPLTTAGNSVVRYDYKAIEGLHLSANYNFASNRDQNNEVTNGTEKSGFGVGGLYEFKVAEGQSATVAAGYTHDAYAEANSNKHRKDAWMVAGSYTINDLTLALDVGGLHEKKANNSKENEYGFAVGAKYQVVPVSSVYGTYTYINGKTKLAGQTTAKEKSHRFMLGTDYAFHKQVKAYIEGSYERTKDLVGAKTIDKNIGVGLRVFW